MSVLAQVMWLALVACAGGSPAPAATVGLAYEDPNRSVQVQGILDSLPAEMVVPAALPETIADPLLLEGWIALYNRQAPVELWEGKTLSGRKLAKYVIDHEVVITWNTSQERPHSSWVDRSGSGAIYITTDIQAQTEGRLARLVGALAHELFHHSLPFGPVADSLYEEYWAFYVGANVSGWGQASFFYTNPLNEASLAEWFRIYGRPGYLETLEAYPAEVLP